MMQPYENLPLTADTWGIFIYICPRSRNDETQPCIIPFSFVTVSKVF